MKKLLIVVVIVTLAVVAALQLLKSSRHADLAAEFVSQHAVLFIEFPDLQQTSARWQKSPIGQMLEDADLRPFWKRPLAELFADEQWQAAREFLISLKMSRVFLAADFSETGTPQIIVGFQAATGTTGIHAALQQLHEAISANGGGGAEPWNIGMASGLRQTWKDSTMWTGVVDSWGVLSNSEAGLAELLERMQGGERKTSLAETERFQKTLRTLQMKHPDVFVFTTPAVVMQRLRDFATSQGAVPITEQFAQLEQWEALTCAVEISASGMSEKAVAWNTSGEALQSDSGLASFGSRFAPADTLFLTSLVWEPGTQLAALWPSIPPDFLQALEFSGIDPSSVAESLGDKMSFSLWWPGGSLLPSALAVLEINDPDSFGSLAGNLGSLLVGDATIDSSGTLTTMTFGADALGLISPTIAYSKDHGFLAFNPGDIASVLDPQRADEGLPSAAIWKSASPFLSKGNIQITMVDVPGIVRRAYATFQPMLGLAATLNSQFSRYADFSRLPEADAFVRHLGPVLARRKTIANGGMMAEISGPVTWSSILLAVPAGLPDGFALLHTIATE